MLDINVDDNNIVYEILSARQIKVSYNEYPIEFTITGNNVTKIRIGNKDITIGDEIEFKINKLDYKQHVEKIIKISNNTAILTTNTLNKCTEFLTPIIGYTKDILRYEYIINSYLSYDFKTITVKYLYINTEAFIKLEKMLSEVDTLISRNDYDNRTVIYEFEIPEEYTKDINKFLDGKYSSFSDKLKHRIMAFYGYKRYGQMYNILYKSPKLKQQLELELGIILPEDIDLYSKPDLDKEILIT